MSLSQALNQFAQNLGRYRVLTPIVSFKLYLEKTLRQNLLLQLSSLFLNLKALQLTSTLANII